MMKEAYVPRNQPPYPPSVRQTCSHYCIVGCTFGSNPCDT